MSGNVTSRDPGAGNAPLPAPNVAALLARNADRFGDRAFLRFEDQVWTHAEYVDRCRRFATWLEGLGPDENGRLHVGVILDNVPAWLVALGGCGIAGATLVGINTTRSADEVVRDATHTEVSVLVHGDEHGDRAAALAALTKPERTLHVDDLDPLLDATDPVGLEEPDVASTWCLVFTSGSTADPKAVICSQRRMLTTGERMRLVLDINPDDVGYVSMPLFHSNSLMVGVMPALVTGASVALARRFSASGWLPDVRRHGATWFNYTGKPLAYILATPEQPDDADNPMRRGFGNEGSAATVKAFEQRFGVELIDAFGPTEGGIAILPDPDTPAGALGRAGEHVQVVDTEGYPVPPGKVGEIVNTAGPGPFEGYWGNEAASHRATRYGWYWTGDLGWIDEDGFLWFAGRNDDWIRVDGENFSAAPIERILAEHPDVVVAAVYAVPDPEAGDQVMAALVLREGASLDGEAFAAWIDGRRDLAQKHRPRFVRASRQLPTTGTNKILTRQLRHERFRLDRVGDDDLWHRPNRAGPFVRFDEDAQAELHAAFEAADRLRFWDS
ncbi:MAG: AMP-binding protein [Nitriliruptorales bacterium]|nr:AMP-binding protein [Nitriliruptorales bacterium]